VAWRLRALHPLLHLRPGHAGLAPAPHWQHSWIWCGEAWLSGCLLPLRDLLGNGRSSAKATLPKASQVPFLCLPLFLVLINVTVVKESPWLCTMVCHPPSPVPSPQEDTLLQSVELVRKPTTKWAAKDTVTLGQEAGRWSDQEGTG
jgi:hypothetical protein